MGVRVIKIDYALFLLVLTFVVSLEHPANAGVISFSTNTPIGFEMPSYSGGVNFTAIGISNPEGVPITLGSNFDPLTGEVTDGDAALMVILNIGNAPLQSLYFGNEGSVDQDSPITSFILPFSESALDSNSYWSFGLNPRTFDATPGATGVFYVGFALVTNADDKVKKVPGITVPFEILITERSAFISPFILRMSSIGGAADALKKNKKNVPEPSTLFLVLVGVFFYGLVQYGFKGITRFRAVAVS